MHLSISDPIVMIAKLGKWKKKIKSRGYWSASQIGFKNNISSDQYDLIVPRTTFYLIFFPPYNLVKNGHIFCKRYRSIEEKNNIV